MALQHTKQMMLPETDDKDAETTEETDDTETNAETETTEEAK